MVFKNERKINILLVDKNETSRHLLKSALSLPSFIISETKDPDVIFAHVERRSIDVICLDIASDPHFTLVRAIKTASSDIGVIIISDDASRNTVLKAIENGADDFVIKPFTSGKMQNAITRCFVSRKRLPVKSEVSQDTVQTVVSEPSDNIQAA